MLIDFAGVRGAGKGTSVNLLHKWMDARWIRTHAYDQPTDEEREMSVKGRDLVSGIPETVRVNSAEIRECMLEPIQQRKDFIYRYTRGAYGDAVSAGSAEIRSQIHGFVGQLFFFFL